MSRAQVTFARQRDAKPPQEGFKENVGRWGGEKLKEKKIGEEVEWYKSFFQKKKDEVM